MSDKFKAINFDLDTKKLKQFYTTQTGKPFNQAYRDIKLFMKANDFTHRQGSGYISKHRLSNTDIAALISKMNILFPWLKSCVKRIDVTVIEKQFDLVEMLNWKNDAERTKNQNNPTRKNSINSNSANVSNEQTVTISKKEYETMQKNLKHLNTVVETTNAVFNANLKLKEDFKKAKSDFLQQKTAVKEKGGLNENKSENKISEHKKKPYKPKL